MADSPKNNQEKMNRMLSAWRTLAPAKMFGGVTLPDFEMLVSSSMDSRAVVAAVDDSRTQAVAAREINDNAVMQKASLIVAGVVADPTEGNDSALYEAMGYIRKSSRASGLTRKKRVSADK